MLNREIKKPKIKFLAGFTIIELMVVITIITIFTSIVISNFYKIRFKFSISRVSYQLGQDLSKAQNMALSAMIYKDLSGIEQAVDGYGVYVDLEILGNKKYVIYADRAPGNEQYDSSDYIVDTIDFSAKEPGIIIQGMQNIIGQRVSINFNSSNLNTNIVDLEGGQNYMDIILAIESDVTNNRRVSVNTKGLVEVK